MVGVSEEFLKQQLGPFQFPRTGQAFDVPERTRGETPLSAGEAIHVCVIQIVAVNKRVFDESFFNGL